AESEELYLVLANIDGPNLRSDKAQSILCQLAACPHIHLLASVDHVNAPLMWDQVKLGRLRWVWTNVTDPTSRYLGETAYEDSQQATTGSRLALSSLTHVFSSLPSNTRKIFLILVRHQLEQLSSKHRSYLGMAFQELVEESKEAFLVNSQLTIRAHLSEFKDHRVIIVRKGADGTEYLYIPLDSAILEEFVEQASVD
ncbi:ORC2, partial [Cordylochernes scorpioides]